MSQIGYIINENLDWGNASFQVESVRGRSGQMSIFDEEEFFRHHHGRLYRTAYRILKDVEWAKDAVQDAFRNIFRHIRDFRGESKLETWMTRIVVNACYAYLRKWKHCRVEPIATDADQNGEKESNTFIDGAPDPRETTERRELGALLRKALDTLGKSHREVIILHDIQDRTIEEIAAHIAVPVGTVKSRLFYGRRMLREALAQCGY